MTLAGHGTHKESMDQEDETMKFNLKALSLTAGILWALAVGSTAVAGIIWQGYGDTFLHVMSSLYPGYHVNRSIGSVVTGTLYALADGAVCGLLFGWIYNMIARRTSDTR